MPRIVLTLLTLALLLAALPFASHAAGEDALQEFHEQLAQMDSLAGEFDQVTRDQEGRVVEENSGEFAMQRPALLRWRIEEPFEQLLVSDGETLWVHDPDLEQVTIHRVDESMQRNAALLLGSERERIDRQYRVDRAEGSEGERFVLTPREPGGDFERLEVRFEDGELRGWRLHTSLGEVSRFSFSDLRVNPELDPGLFEFEAPPGADVLDER